MASYSRYRALGPELIPVYRQSARRWLKFIHSVVGCHYFLPGLRLLSQPQSITALWPVPSYAAWWQRHIGVNNLPKIVTQLLPRVGFEPTTCWSQVQRSICCATTTLYWRGGGPLSILITLFSQIWNYEWTTWTSILHHRRHYVSTVFGNTWYTSYTETQFNWILCRFPSTMRDYDKPCHAVVQQSKMKLSHFVMVINLFIVNHSNSSAVSLLNGHNQSDGSIHCHCEWCALLCIHYNSTTVQTITK